MELNDFWPPSSLRNIKAYYNPEPPSPPQHSKGCGGPQPTYPPINKNSYGYQSLTAQLTKEEYDDPRYTYVTPLNEGYYGLQPPHGLQNNEGDFGPKFSSQLLCENAHSNRHAATPSSRLQPPFTPSKESYRLLPPSLISSDFKNYVIKPKFGLLHNKVILPPFRDTSLEDSVDPSFLQVSIVPAVSFTIQDTTQFGELSSLLEDPLTLARNLTLAFGAVRDSTLKPGPSHLISPPGE
jgi:hypothetical protein